MLEFKFGIVVRTRYLEPILIELLLLNAASSVAVFLLFLQVSQCYFFPLHFRMVNILLPAYSRHYSALHRAGQVTAADEMENHELEHLVLRERGVAWADQEGEGLVEESQVPHEVGHSELAPVLSFSHLLYHQNSPCSKSSYSYHPICSSVVVYLAYV